jgi:putative membrane protein
VARPQDGTGVRLAHYQIACCAADAVAAVVRVIGLDGAPPARDGWLQVIGTFHGLGADGVPELEVTSSQPIPAPVDPYES